MRALDELDVVCRRGTLLSVALAATLLAVESVSHYHTVALVLGCTLGSWDGFGYCFQQMITMWPPEKLDVQVIGLE